MSVLNVGDFITTRYAKRGGIEVKFKKGYVATSILLGVTKENEPPTGFELDERLFASGCVTFRVLESVLGLEKAQKLVDKCEKKIRSLSSEE